MLVMISIKVMCCNSKQHFTYRLLAIETTQYLSAVPVSVPSEGKATMYNFWGFFELGQEKFK